jgi:phage/plasmid-associated DNA primase
VQAAWNLSQVNFETQQVCYADDCLHGHLNQQTHLHLKQTWKRWMENSGTARLSSRSLVSCCTKEVKDYKQHTEQLHGTTDDPNKQIGMLGKR